MGRNNNNNNNNNNKDIFPEGVGRKEGRKRLFNDELNTFYFTFIWRWTYSKGPFR